jgi:branched-chain amino acid aminotransferase
MTVAAPAAAPPFGSVFAAQMGLTRFEGERFESASIRPTGPIELHPGAHVLHYASSCFEGLKAYRAPDGTARIFRLDAHIARMQDSAQLLCLPVPPTELLRGMVIDTVTANRDEIPKPPGSLYLRPTMIGTTANVGAAASPPTEGMLFVLACPVGDYFAGGIRPLRLVIETEAMRATPGFGRAKAGANYAAALRIVVAARDEHQADQVLFAPGGDVQETGASNFLLLDDRRVITKPLDSSFLHGVTRSSVLTIAADLGYGVEERQLVVAEVLDWARRGEAALSGTAAVLSGVGTLVLDGEEHPVGAGEVGPNTLRLRRALTDIQFGAVEDTHGWVTLV